MNRFTKSELRTIFKTKRVGYNLRGSPENFVGYENSQYCNLWTLCGSVLELDPAHIKCTLRIVAGTTHKAAVICTRSSICVHQQRVSDRSYITASHCDIFYITDRKVTSQSIKCFLGETAKLGSKPTLKKDCMFIFQLKNQVFLNIYSLFRLNYRHDAHPLNYNQKFLFFTTFKKCLKKTKTILRKTNRFLIIIHRDYQFDQ